ncbi:hypothetical protein LDENG_00275430 [Lucifuga dentata]|nr:hypothetical protein LDENG_00275430 [Lucifuga dentata]
MSPDLRAFSPHCGLSSPAESSFSPESCRSLLLRSRSLRLEDWQLRTELRASQLLHDRLQRLSLRRDSCCSGHTHTHTHTHLYIYILYCTKVWNHGFHIVSMFPVKLVLFQMYV